MSCTPVSTAFKVTPHLFFLLVAAAFALSLPAPFRSSPASVGGCPRPPWPRCRRWAPRSPPRPWTPAWPRAMAAAGGFLHGRAASGNDCHANPRDFSESKYWSMFAALSLTFLSFSWQWSLLPKSSILFQDIILFSLLQEFDFKAQALVCYLQLWALLTSKLIMRN